MSGRNSRAVSNEFVKTFFYQFEQITRAFGGDLQTCSYVEHALDLFCAELYKSSFEVPLQVIIHTLKINTHAKNLYRS